MALDLGTIFVKIGAKNDDLMRTLSRSEQALDKFSEKVSRFGRKLTLGVSTPLLGVGYAAAKMAGEVVESESLFEISMGKMTKAGQDFTKAYSKAMGINEYEMRRQMGVFKVMAESMRVPEEAAYDLSKGLTTLAYDLSAFYNISFEESFSKLQSGIVGLTMPLRQLGIDITEATVQSYALRTGLIDQGETLTQTGKVLARYGAIMEQASKAQGHLARELDNPLSKQRILREQVKALTKEVGDALLPVFDRLLSVSMDIVKRLRDLTDEFKKLSPEVQDAWIKVGLFVTAIGPLALIVGGVAKAFSGLTKLVRGLGVAIGALVGFGGKLVFAFEAWSGGAATFGEALSFLAGGKIGLVVAGIGLLIGAGALLIKNWDSVSYWGLQTWGKVKKSIDEANASANDFLASVNFLGKGDMYADAAERFRQAASKEAQIMDTRRLAYEAANKKAGEEDAEAYANSFADIYESILSGLDPSLFSGVKGGTKKTIAEIEQSLQEALNRNRLAAENMGDQFDKLGEDLAAYENALMEIFEAGIDPRTDATAKNIVNQWRQMLADMSEALRLELLDTYKAIEIDSLSLSGTDLTVSGTSLGLDMESFLSLTDDQMVEFVGSMAAARKSITELDNAATLGLISNQQKWQDSRTILKDLTDDLIGLYSVMEDSTARDAIGTLIQDISEQEISLGVTLDILNQQDFEQKLLETAQSTIHTGNLQPRSELKVWSDALSEYLMAGFSENSPFALDLKSKISELQDKVGELDFTDAMQEIEDDLTAGLERTVLAARAAIAKGETFDSQSYQAGLYEQAIKQRQSLMLQEGKSIQEVLSATAAWNAKLQDLNESIKEAANKQRIDNIKQAYIQATDAALLGVEQQIAESLGESFDPKNLQIDALKSAIRATTQEMVAQGKTQEEVQTAIKEWVDELNKLKPDLFQEWADSLKKDTLSRFPIANKTYSAGKSASKAFASEGASAAMGGAVGSMLTLIGESETFKTLLDNINPLLQTLADAVGLLIEPLLPLVVVISSTLTPVFTAIGTMLSTLFEPAMKAIFPIFKSLGVVTIGVVSAFNWLQLQSYKLINSMFQWLAGLPLIGRSFRSLAKASQIKVDSLEQTKDDLGDAMKDLINLTYDEAMSKAKLADAAKEATEALRNVPSGFKVALRRYQTADPVGGVYQPTAQTPTTININGDIYGYDDFERKVKGVIRDTSTSGSLAAYGV